MEKKIIKLPSFHVNLDNTFAPATDAEKEL